MAEKIHDMFLRSYNAKEHETDTYRKWEESGLFNPDTCIKRGATAADAAPFSIVLPPPNATGVLHLGHALEDSMQDALIRYHRMLGKRTLWVPGTDHAAIATDAKVTKLLDKQGIKKHEIGREAFLEHVETFVQESRDTIRNQVRRMGASLDWSREAFTLDQKREQAVHIAFKRMYDAGLIYRGHRIVNWDPKGQTVISDDEVVHEPQKGTLYTFRYSSDFPFSIATTRPETKLGDTAVAVHPDDERYAQYIGKEYSFTFAGEPVTVKVVGDESVDPEYGTGALGVTPAHSMSDWELAQRHDLSVKQVINEYGKMMVGMKGVTGEKTTVARERIATWLQEENLLEAQEEIDQNISRAERTNGVIEPLPKEQWFIDVNKTFTMEHSSIDGIADGDETTLKQLMIQAVKSEQIAIMPERFKKIYYHWVENLRDWCISRQIWYGHRIPVWYKGEDIHVGATPPDDSGWKQDEDTLDTWFSSGLWTFSTLGWPEETDDLHTYHPTNVINPGYEILFFWVARMVLMSTYLLGEIPFQTVYLHGMLRDNQGQKFSKSLGNGGDPIEIIDQYGADALRMSLIIGIGPGADSTFDLQKVKAYSKFANKIWNATRFVLENVLDTFSYSNKPDLDGVDQGYLERMDVFTTEVTKEMDEYKFYLVGEKLYHFFWHEFADVMLEESKKRMDTSPSAHWTLYHLLVTQLKLLHPFMPFITETIWQQLPHTTESDMLLVERWPGAE